MLCAVVVAFCCHRDVRSVSASMRGQEAGGEAFVICVLQPWLGMLSPCGELNVALPMARVTRCQCSGSSMTRYFEP